MAHLASALAARPGTELRYGPHRLYWSDLESASDGEHLALVLDESMVPPGNTVFWMRTSESLVAMLFDGTTEVMLFDGERRTVYGGITGPLGLAIEPRVVGNDVFWTAYLDHTTRVMAASMTREPAVLDEGDLGHVNAKGEDLVWRRVVERQDGYVAASELWVAPVTADPSDLRARQIGPRIDIAWSGGEAVGEGLYAYRFQELNPPYLSTIYVIDLRGGRRRLRYDLPNDPRWLADWVEWVTCDEVGVVGAGFLPDGTRLERALMRIRLSAFVPDEP